MNLLQLAIVTGGTAAVLCAIMTAAWVIQQRSGNSGWVDAIWTFGTGGVACIASLAPLGQSPWPHWRQVAVAALVSCWCLRLGLHIAYRTRSIQNDPRYRNLIDEWGGDAPRRMFWFLQSQAAIGVVLVLSIALAAHNLDPSLRVQDILGVVLLIGAIIGEAMADWQLKQFASNPASRNAVCNVGLWRWSRHPNYFFEWLSWIGYPLIAIDVTGSNPYGWLALLAPACMYWVLVHVSGVPPLEDHMLKSRGEAFRVYQRVTRPFFPLPKF